MQKQIPNLFTLLNLIFGCMAIVAVLQNGIEIRYDAEGEIFVTIPEKLWLASVYIFLAAVVDFFDGFVARLMGASSEMGKQLDSLADVVSFGVAPSMIIYQFLRLSYASQPDGLNISTIWLMPAFLIAAAGAYRLARFNIDTSQSMGFKGMPIPAAGIFIAALPMVFWTSNNSFIINLIQNKWFLYAVIVLVSWLMISKIPMLALKFKTYSIQENKSKYFAIAHFYNCHYFFKMDCNTFYYSDLYYFIFVSQKLIFK